MELQVRIKWQGLPDFEATWDNADSINQLFLDFSLQDKANLHGGKNVMTSLRV